MAKVMVNNDPKSFNEAKDSTIWQQAMDEEYDALVKNHTWELVPLPKGKTSIGCKWVYKTKYDGDGNVDKHKARLVAQGFSQVMGIDYNETFAPVARMNTIKLLLALAARFKWEVHHLDVKSAFLNGELKEEIYMRQPPGYVFGDSLVCKLNRSIYGLKQAPKAWYDKIDSHLIALGFRRCDSDSNLYVKKHGNDCIFVVLYVDDLLVTGSNIRDIDDLKESLMKTFDMHNLGLLHHYLGLQVTQNDDGISLSQPKFIMDLLDKFGMTDCKPCKSPFQSGVKLSSVCSSRLCDATLYRQLVGSLLFLTHTRPDIAFIVNLCSRFMQKPHEEHWLAAKRILRYLKGTMYYGLHYSPSDDPLVLTGYSDSDWAGDIDDRKSTAGYIFYFGSSPIIWQTKKMNTLALSTTEAEYRALVEAGKEALWIKSFMAEIGFPLQQSIVLNIDNQGAISIATNPVGHSRTKHVELHLHFIRNHVYDGTFQLVYFPSEKQVVDVLTKSLTNIKFCILRDLLGMAEVIIKGGFG